MLISATTEGEPTRSPTLHWKADDRYIIGWKGSVYLPGFTAGEATIAQILRDLKQHSAVTLSARLFGVFGLFIYDRIERSWSILADNTGLYHIFYNTDHVATSFLELLTVYAKAKERVDNKAIVEFVMYGCNFGKRTPIDGVYKLGRREIIRIEPGNKGGRVDIVAKPKPVATSTGNVFVVQHFDNLARAINGRRISADVTGGFDSRVIACLLHRGGLEFECALAGIPGTEVEIAKKVAAVLGRPMYFHQHDISNLEADLPAVFAAGDGLMEIPRLHRDRQLCLDRLSRGIELMIHGGGGEFFRDHYVVQDFPRYGSKRINVPRYYWIRFAASSIPQDQLSPAGNTLVADIHKDTLEKFSAIEEINNNRTYERIFYEYRVPEFYGTTFSNYINLGLDVAAPFLDERVFEVATNIPPWNRVFMLWHRRMVTEYCPELAMLPTAEGYTASSDTRHLIMELGRYARVQASRVARKLSERHLGKALFYRVGELAADSPGYRQKLRASSFFSDAVERLKEKGILAPDVRLDQVKDGHVGRMMTMGMLLAYLEGELRLSGEARLTSTA